MAKLGNTVPAGDLTVDSNSRGEIPGAAYNKLLASEQKTPLHLVICGPSPVTDGETAEEATGDGRKKEVDCATLAFSPGCGIKYGSVAGEQMREEDSDREGRGGAADVLAS